MKVEPVWKWPGGKRRLMPYVLPALGTIPDRYVEPFTGGGACFFALRSGGFQGDALLNDLCRPVAETLRAVRRNPEAVITAFARLAAGSSRERYYEIRDIGDRRGPADPIEYAAWFLYLNKTGFNGLWRENAAGQCNVPFGDRLPSLDFDLLRAASRALRSTVVSQDDFSTIELHRGDRVYCDPPYLPITATANFTGYVAGGFTGGDQLRLAKWARAGADTGARVVISNAGHVDSIAAFKAVADRVVEIPKAARNISCKGGKRDAVSEYLFILEAA